MIVFKTSQRFLKHEKLFFLTKIINQMHKDGARVVFIAYLKQEELV
jgi:hypothetical protein